MSKRILLVALAGLLAPRCAHADGEKPWLALNSGGGSYAMSALNQEIDTYNAANAGSGALYDRVKHGPLFGGAIGFELPSQWSFGVGIDRLYADTKASNSSATLEYNLNANCWRTFAEYALAGVGRPSLRGGIGVGVIAQSGKEIAAAPGVPKSEHRLTGYGMLYEAYGGGDWWATSSLAFEGTAGFRRAKIPKVKADGLGTLVTATGDPVAIDFTGPYVRLGVKLVGKVQQ
jgi:hypothetical protein